MTLTQAQCDFIEAFIAPLPKSDGKSIDLPTALADWMTASETVDGQISTLQNVLKQSDDEDLHEIAEYGLNALTADHKVKLMAAMQDARGGAANALDNLRQTAASFRSHLESSGSVSACDSNPFGVSMSIRATLVPALLKRESV